MGRRAQTYTDVHGRTQTPTSVRLASVDLQDLQDKRSVRYTLSTGVNISCWGRKVVEGWRKVVEEEMEGWAGRGVKNACLWSYACLLVAAGKYQGMSYGALAC